MAYPQATTETLARRIRALIQLREVRDFIKAEVTIGEEADVHLWMDTHSFVVENIQLTQKLIGELMPSGRYEMKRDIPKP